MSGAAIDLREYIRPGDTVLIGQGGGEPRSLVEALVAQRHALAPLRVVVGGTYSGLLRVEHADALEFVGFGGIGGTSALTRAGVFDVLPVHLGSMPGHITSGRLAVDVVLVQLSTPDEHGNHSLGLIADYLQAAIAVARTTVAEINPHVPFTYGDTVVPPERITVSVTDERAPLAVERRAPLPEDERIAAHVAEIIPDGATLQFGIGGTPDAVLARLTGHRDLGVHSGLLSDAVVDLIEAGAVTNARKPIDQGRTVTGSLLGGERLYRWADRNPALSMRSLDYTHNPRVLAAFDTLFAINSAIEVDLTGSINAEVASGRYAGGIGGQGAFVRAGLTSAHGRSIIALPSVAKGGEVSRIVGRLADGVTTTARADADLVVTEYGIADLRGMSIAERISRMTAIADPRHRDSLERDQRDIVGRRIAAGRKDG